MLLIVCGAHDLQAQRLADRLGPSRAAKVDTVDLSQPGWKLSSEKPGEARLIADRRPISEESISTVLVRRLAVYPEELRHVHPDDRSFVASELSAMLMWWLHQFRGPVLNRPAAGLLCGPYGRPEQWLVAAARAGLDVVPLVRTTQLGSPSEPAHATVTVLDGRALGSTEPIVQERAITLAKVAGASLAEVGFDPDGRIIGANSFPVMSNTVIEALAEFARQERTSLISEEVCR